MTTILRLPRVIEVTGLGRSTLYSLIRDGRFPEPISLTGGGGRAVGWNSESVEAWIAERIKQNEPTEKAEVMLPGTQLPPGARFGGRRMGLGLSAGRSQR